MRNSEYSEKYHELMIYHLRHLLKRLDINSKKKESFQSEDVISYVLEKISNNYYMRNIVNINKFSNVLTELSREVADIREILEDIHFKIVLKIFDSKEDYVQFIFHITSIYATSIFPDELDAEELKEWLLINPWAVIFIMMQSIEWEYIKNEKVIN